MVAYKLLRPVFARAKLYQFFRAALNSLRALSPNPWAA